MTPTKAAEKKTLRVGDITIDETANRYGGPRPHHVAKIRDNFNLAAVGTVTVSDRGDGTMVVLDGMHRLQAMRDLGMDDEQVQADVFTGLTPAEEAAEFVLLNTRLNTHPLDEYRKSVEAGLEPYVGIDKRVRHAGLKVASGSENLSCVGVLRRLYLTDPTVLEVVLHLVSGVWGKEQPKATSTGLVAGLGAFLLRYGEAVDVEHLATKLGEKRPVRVVQLANSSRDRFGGSLPINVARVVLDLYNTGRKTKRLPAW